MLLALQDWMRYVLRDPKTGRDDARPGISQELDARLQGLRDRIGSRIAGQNWVQLWLPDRRKDRDTALPI